MRNKTFNAVAWISTRREKIDEEGQGLESRGKYGAKETKKG